MTKTTPTVAPAALSGNYKHPPLKPNAFCIEQLTPVELEDYDTKGSTLTTAALGAAIGMSATVERVRWQSEHLRIFGVVASHDIRVGIKNTWQEQKNKVPGVLGAATTALSSGVAAAVAAIPLGIGSTTVNLIAAGKNGVSDAAAWALRQSYDIFGSGTSKSLAQSGPNDQGFTVKAIWNVAGGQEILMRKGLLTLMKMAYPRAYSINQEAGVATLFAQVDKSASGVSGDELEKAQSAATLAQADLDEVLERGTEKQKTDATTKRDEANAKLEQLKASDAYSQSNKADDNSAMSYVRNMFGQRLAKWPTPVKLTIGQYVHVRPLVITNVDIKASPTMFVSPTGRHMPTWVSANIAFNFWMTPKTTENWLEYFGTQMFGIKSEIKPAT
jgi:hypothetical protein